MTSENRKNLGIELYFNLHASVFAGLRESAEDDVLEAFDNAPLHFRFMAAKLMTDCVAEIKTLCSGGEGILPRGFGQDEDAFISQEEMPAYLKWLIDLSVGNEQLRERQLCSMNTVTEGLEDFSASFIRSAFTQRNEHVTINLDGDRLEIAFDERVWGKAVAVFNECVVTCPSHGAGVRQGREGSGCEMKAYYFKAPISGHLFNTDARLLDDGRYEFCLLVDTRFKEDNYCERLLEDEGWLELKFMCSAIKADVALCDYTGRLARMGASRLDIIIRSCNELLDKRALLGEECVTRAESSLLPLCRLLSGMSKAFGGQNPLYKRQYGAYVLEALDNRYAMHSFCEILKECGCELLEKILSKAMELWYELDTQALKAARVFALQFERQIEDGSAVRLIEAIYKLFESASLEFFGDTPRSREENLMASFVRDKVEPKLESLGFSGPFPHYRRSRESGADYISIMLFPYLKYPLSGVDHGIEFFLISLGVASITAKHLDHLEANGVSFVETNAVGFKGERHGGSRYAELAGADDDVFLCINAEVCNIPQNAIIQDGGREAEQNAEVCREMYSSDKQTGDILRSAVTENGKPRNDAHELGLYIDIAERKLSAGKIPFDYAMSRLRAAGYKTPFYLSAAYYLPFGAIAAFGILIIILTIAKPLYTPAYLIEKLFFAALGGFALSAVIAAVTRIFKAFDLWRYRS